MERMAEVAPGVVRLVAPNPSAFTGPGTNTYVLDGRAETVVVDPGPQDEGHLSRLLDLVAGRRVAAVVVTHPHRDHSALAPRFGRAVGAPVLAWGSAGDGRRPLPSSFAPGAGADATFRPERRLLDGEEVVAGGMRLRAVHTPGHMGSHLCLDGGDWLLSGDHAMGWATSVVAPPDGDMGDYVESLRRLLALGPRRLLPGHGEAVADGAGRLGELLAHRLAREAQVLGALGAEPRTAGEIAGAIYHPVQPALLAAAEATVLAHLLDLARRGLAAPAGPLSPAAGFVLS